MVIYAVRIDLEPAAGPGEQAVSRAGRLHDRLREQEGGAVQQARSLFRARRGPHHGLAQVTMTVHAADQGKAATTALKALRAATGDDRRAWETTRALISVEPARARR